VSAADARAVLPGPAPVTRLERDGRHALYLVHTDVPLYRERIVKMGWWPRSEPGEFARRLDWRGDVEAVHQRFAQHLEEMLLQSARLRPVNWEQALELMSDRLDGSGVDWWLYGSVALAVRGLDVNPGDIDFAVSDAMAAGDLFADVLVEPATQLDDWLADSIGRAFHGALFEWLSGPHPSPLPHEHAPLVGMEFDVVRWREKTLRVPPLLLQLRVAEARGLGDRADAIRRLAAQK
jgi:hypothetical protein